MAAPGRARVEPESTNAVTASWIARMRWRLALAVAAVAVVALASATWLIARERDRLLTIRQREVDAEATRGAEVVQLWLRERLADADVLADNPVTERALTHGAEGDLAELTRVLERMRTAYGYVEIFVLALPAGRSVASPNVPLPDGVRSVVEHMHAVGSPVVELLEGGAHLGIIAPAPAVAGGAVVLEMDPHKSLYPLLSADTHTGTRETLLVKARADRVIVASPRRGRTTSEPALILPFDQRLAAAAATSGVATSGDYLDYRGVEVLASTRGVGVPGWGVVAKVDRAEALEPLAPYSRTAWALSGLVVVATWALGVALSYRARGHVLARALDREHAALELQRAEERSAAARRELEAQLVQAQKMEAVGRLAGGIAHDFNNLLTLVLVAADDLVAAMPEGSPLHQDAVDVKHAAARATELTRQLLTFSRKNVHRREVVDLNQSMRAVRSLLQRAVREDIELSLDLCDGSAWCTTDRTQLEQALLNLVVNAKDAMPKGGRIVVGSRIADVADAPAGMPPTSERCVALTVRDTGEGIPPAALDKIFDPFFTTKPQGQGTGLGLAMVYSFMVQSGGVVRATSELGQGSTFTLWFPLCSPPALPRTATPAKERTGAGSETILVMDDSPEVRTVAARVLRAAGFQVLEAGGGADALALHDVHGTRIAAVLTDVVMPGLGGRELCDTLRARGCTAPVVFMSGYADDEALRADIDATREHFVHKPFTADGLVGVLRTVLANHTQPA